MLSSPDDKAEQSPKLILSNKLKRKRKSGLSFNRLMPNILTMIGLCSGLSAMKFSLHGRFDIAMMALLFAACMDGLDGRIARLLHGTTRFGAEFDSLSDIICFGLVPPFILMMWTPSMQTHFWYVPCLMFTVCMALRLARFNAALDDNSKPEYAAGFFSGVPAPAGAGLVLFPIFVGLEAKSNNILILENISHTPELISIFLISISFLTVSSLPVWSFKNFKIPTTFILPILLSIGLFVAFLITEPWGALASAGLFYICMLPFSRRSYWNLKKRAQQQRNIDKKD